jgi:predicted MPP superfamily phosphohydrolase
MGSVRLHFFMMIGLLGCGLGLLQWYVYRKGFTLLQPWWTAVFCLLLPAIFLLPHFTRGLPLGLTRLMATLGGFWLGFFYYSVLALVLYLFLFLGFALAGQLPAWTVFAPRLVRVFLAVILVLLAWGGYNARHPVYRQVAVTTAKVLPRDVKIAFVTDLHLGTVLGDSYCAELVQRLNAVQPDLIILGGDQVDESLALVEQEGSYKHLADLKAPLGVYVVLGNHDYLGGTWREEIQLFTGLGLHYLVDERVNLPDNLELTGLPDYSMGGRATALQPEATSRFRILVDHQPRRMRQAAAAGYDLYLAGHTHAGQLYPNRLVTQKMYELDYGARYFEQLLAVTSDGYGFWGVPVRTGPAPEIVVLTVHSQK